VISKADFKACRIDVSGQPKPIVGLPDGVIKYRVRVRHHNIPYVFLRFSDRIQKHVLLISGSNWEPYETPEAVNVFSAPLRLCGEKIV
jgi:hypothetical protein